MRIIQTFFCLLVAASLVGPAIAQESAAYFDAPTVQAIDQMRFERTLRYDDDAYPDVVGWWWENNDNERAFVWVYRNRGDGDIYGWTGSTEDIPDAHDKDTYVSQSIVGSFNADQNEDFIFSFQQQVIVYIANPSSFPTRALNVMEPAIVRGLAVGDFNNDSYMDFATCWSELKIYLNDGTANFTPQPPISVGNETIELLSTELDGNGDDIVVVQDGKLTFVELIDGTLSNLWTLDHQVTNAPNGALGDIDADNDDDIVVFGKESYQVFRRWNSGTFIRESLRAGGPATDLADIDGDGDADGVCCGGGGTIFERNVAPSKFEIAMNLGDGVFDTAFAIDSVGAHHLAGATDMDLDGDLDLIGGRCIYYNRGSITDRPTHSFGLDEGDTISSRAVADVDRDGDLDFDIGLGSQRINRGDGLCSLGGQPVEAPPPGTYFVGPGFPGDWDGDGDTDVLVSLRDVNTDGFLSMRLLKNNGGGTLLDAGDAAEPGINFNIAPDVEEDLPRAGIVADTDQDGDLDFIINDPDYFATEWRYYRNRGNGFFDPTPETNLLWKNVLAIADLDGDDIVDLLGTDSTSIFWRRGLGGGDFGGVLYLNRDWRMVGFWDRPAIADVDDDGDNDIVFVNADGAQAGILLNDGSASFTLLRIGNQNWKFYGNSRRAFVLDINDDGRKDVVIGASVFADEDEDVRLRAPIFTVYEQNADGSDWVNTTDFVMDAAVLADADSDGDLDLIGDAVYNNTQWFGPSAGSYYQYGQGSPGSDGTVPRLGLIGPHREGATASLCFSGLLGGTTSLLMVGLQESDWAFDPSRPDLIIYTFPWIRLHVLPIGGPSGVPGAGFLEIDYAVTDYFDDLTLYFQILSLDPLSPNGVSTSNGVHVHYGQ